MKKVLLFVFFGIGFSHIQSASAEVIISCGHPYSGAYVRFFPLGFPEVGSVSWGYEGIPLEDCSQSTPNVIVCHSETAQTGASGRIKNRLEIRMNGNTGTGVFRRDYIPDHLNVSSGMEFKDCRRIQR